MTMKTEPQIRKHMIFLESQKSIFKNIVDKHPFTEGAKQLLKDVDHEIEIFKWVLNEPSKYGEVKL